MCCANQWKVADIGENRLGQQETVELGEVVGFVETMELEETADGKVEGLSWQEDHLGDQDRV